MSLSRARTRGACAHTSTHPPPPLGHHATASRTYLFRMIQLLSSFPPLPFPPSTSHPTLLLLRQALLIQPLRLISIIFFTQRFFSPYAASHSNYLFNSTIFLTLRFCSSARRSSYSRCVSSLTRSACWRLARMASRCRRWCSAGFRV